MENTMIQTKRSIDRIYHGQGVSEGGGVKLKRFIGTPALRNLDPFLMLDEFKSDNPNDYNAGFPNHPHRGFQTVTYLLAGKARHKDNKGHEGLLRAGGVQWMNAGRGVIHSEMPEQENGLLWGFQLWVNLPGALKMSEPDYQEFEPEQIPLHQLSDGVHAKIIAGQTDSGIQGAVKNISTQPLFMDVRLDADKQFSQTLPAEHTAFVYLYKGSVSIAGHSLEAGELAVLNPGELLEVTSQTEDTGFLLVAGAPIHEPIEQYGPFVMNTKVEIQEAILDYESGRFAN